MILLEYTIMPNHYHFLLVPLHEKSLPKFMQGIGTIYARYYNRVTHSTGPVFNGHYKYKGIDTEQYYQVVREYIRENLKKAGLVKKSSDWKYCSTCTSPINKMPALEQFNAELTLYDRVEYSGLYKRIPEKLRNKVVIGEFRTSAENDTGVDSSFFLG